MRLSTYTIPLSIAGNKYSKIKNEDKVIFYV